MTPTLRTFGSDPEVLLHNGKEFISAIGKVPGTKDAPYVIYDGMVHCDNVTAEMNTVPCATSTGFDRSVDVVLKQLTSMVKLHDLHISELSIGEYSDTELSHPDALVAGCEVDWNAYTRRLNNPANYDNTNQRCAGGHLHLGCAVDTSDVPALVQALDVVVGLPILLHEDIKRRELYGKAGSFRIKEYGLEYRTPSNFWVFSPDRRIWVAEQVKDAFNHINTLTCATPEEVRHIIDTGDKGRAQELMYKIGLTPCPN